VLAKLRECEKQHRDPWLCIDELEDTGILWELVSISHGKPPLGVLFNVWRRSTLLTLHGKLEDCNWTPRVVRGRILSYCAEDAREQWPSNSHTLSPSPFKSLRGVLRDGDPPPAALLYLYCHCYRDNSIMYTVLGDRRDQEESIDTGFLLDGGERKLLTERQPVVFLNACRTASPSAKEVYLPGTQTRFADLFLQLGAVGVIATLAPPLAQFAASLGERIITLARDTEKGVRTVPEVLRALRREVYEQYRSTEVMEDRESADHFYHAFLYVYFGIPRAYLELD
jgi:hypothetical protein